MGSTVPGRAPLRRAGSLSLITMVEPISDIDDLRRHLQWAVEIEHSTIPPYEARCGASWTPSRHAATSIKYVVREEMLHLALAANLLTAVGGTPRFTDDAVPRYPEPMRHHDPTEPLVLHLAPASIDLIRDVFLRIERPEEAGARPEADRYETLAQFYEAIVEAFDRLGPGIFTGDPRRQVTRGYAGHGGGTLFAITDQRTARLAIEEIVEQVRGPRTTDACAVGRRGAHAPRTVRVRGRVGARPLLAIPRHRRGTDPARARCVRCMSIRRPRTFPTATCAISRGSSMRAIRCNSR